MLRNIFVAIVAFFLFSNNFAYALALDFKPELDKDNYIRLYSRPLKGECVIYKDDSAEIAYHKIEMCVPFLKENEAYRLSVFAFSEDEWSYIEKKIKESGRFEMLPYVGDKTGALIPWDPEMESASPVDLTPYIIIKNK